MSSYLARVEIINGYSNIRPVMEMVDGGLVEVDEGKFGQYGTITIGALYGTESPFIQDQKYCIFTLTDAEFNKGIDGKADFRISIIGPGFSSCHYDYELGLRIK